MPLRTKSQHSNNDYTPRVLKHSQNLVTYTDEISYSKKTNQYISNPLIIAIMFIISDRLHYRKIRNIWIYGKFT